MTIWEAIREIEGLPFSTRLNIATDSRMFFRIANGEPAVRDCWKEMEKSENAETIFSRVGDLSRQLTDIRYENSSDVALAVYLWLLNAKKPSFAMLAAQTVSQLPRCWWAETTADQILRGRSAHAAISDSASKSNEPFTCLTNAPETLLIPRTFWESGSTVHSGMVSGIHTAGQLPPAWMNLR